MEITIINVQSAIETQRRMNCTRNRHKLAIEQAIFKSAQTLNNALLTKLYQARDQV
jgi:hypothetical protein